MNQVAQLRRDKTQFDREDARHERERQEALEDELRKRREDKYVHLLTALTELDRPLEGITALLSEVVNNREKADDPEAIGDLDRALAEACAQGCLRTWATIEETHRDLSAAFFAAYAVASPNARDHGLRIVDWPLTIVGVEMQVFNEHDFTDFHIRVGDDFRQVDRREYVKYLTDRVHELRNLIADLDRLLREELRLA